MPSSLVCLISGDDDGDGDADGGGDGGRGGGGGGRGDCGDDNDGDDDGDGDDDFFFFLLGARGMPPLCAPWRLPQETNDQTTKSRLIFLISPRIFSFFCSPRKYSNI